jgi:hypothetical protein
MSFDKSANVSAGMQLFMQRLSVLITEEGVSRGLSFKHRSDDVFVVTPPKCGTTWMQQILFVVRAEHIPRAFFTHCALFDQKCAHFQLKTT